MMAGGWTDMTVSQWGRIVRRIWGNASSREEDSSDDRLMGRFVERGDESAFEELFRRHAEMVMGVCRRILGDADDADDAFQAVWLVLAHKAPVMRDRGAVGAWLFGVARRTALYARRERATRRDKEALAPVRAEGPAPGGTELRAVVDEELARLPDRFRAVLVLCDLEGRTRCEASGALGIPEGTVASRLARARAVLARRLERRGLAPAGVAPLVPSEAVLGLPIAAASLKAALAAAAGKTMEGAPAVALAQGVLGGMAVNKLKTFAMVVLILGALSGGAYLACDEDAVDKGVSTLRRLIGLSEDWPGSRTRSEISQLSQAIGAFKQEFNVTYLPSWVVLREDGLYNMSNQDEKDTVVFLQQMFGKRLDLRSFVPASGATPQQGNDWNGNGVLDAGRIVLTGDQALVFFLGGIPAAASQPYGVLGFSTSPTNPSAPGGNRRGPYFEFQPSRLVGGNGGFFRYLDAFKTGSPYAYFSSYKSTNGYNRYGSSDCENLGVSPYQESSEVFINPNGFQILSAGANGVFGPGGTSWDRNVGYPSGEPGADDFSNFSASRLGLPQS
jgi:RNA polymerase sigma factor (sigma-70 family)